MCAVSRYGRLSFIRSTQKSGTSQIWIEQTLLETTWKKNEEKNRKLNNEIKQIPVVLKLKYKRLINPNRQAMPVDAKNNIFLMTKLSNPHHCSFKLRENFSPKIKSKRAFSGERERVMNVGYNATQLQSNQLLTVKHITTIKYG